MKRLMLGVSDRIDESVLNVGAKACGSLQVYNPSVFESVPLKFKQCFKNTTSDVMYTRIDLENKSFHALNRNQASDRLELFLKHNPFFSNAKLHNKKVIVLIEDPEKLLDPKSVDSKRMEQKLGMMMQVLNQAAKNATIFGYGISSHNYFFQNEENYQGLINENLEHFKTIQAPLNLMEMDAMQKLLPWTRVKNIEFIAMRPLTAFARPDDDNKQQQQKEQERYAYRLVDGVEFPIQYLKARDDLLLNTLKVNEEIDSLELAKGKQWMSTLIRSLDQQVGKFTSVVHWDDEFVNVITPMILRMFDEIDQLVYDQLQEFFKHHRSMVAESAGVKTRAILAKQAKYYERLKKQDANSLPLQKFAIEELLKIKEVDKILINPSTIEQLNNYVKWFS